MTGDWESVPGWIKDKIRLEHETEAIAWLMGKDIRHGMATDAEMAASLYCASMQAPMTHDAGMIYSYICTRLLDEKGWAVPSEIRVTELTQDQERTLRDWRYQLYRHRGKAETPITKAVKEVFRERRIHMQEVSV